jgi:hypothetical protein
VLGFGRSRSLLIIASELILKLRLYLEVVFVPDPFADMGEQVEDGDDLFRCPGRWDS